MRAGLLRPAVLAALVTVGGQAWPPEPVSAAALPAFRGYATAEGVRLSLLAQNAPVTNAPVDGGAPIAHAALDSLGSSEAYASSPYPGYYAVAGPGLVRALSQGQLNLPGYPLYARSEYPATPEEQVDGPLVGLSAQSTEQDSHSVARFGPDDNSVAETRVSALGSEGQITSEATSSVFALRIGPLLLSDFRTEARMTRTTGAATAGTGSSVGHGELGGVPFVVTGEGIQLAGGQGMAPPEPGPVLDALAEQGATLTYLRTEKDSQRVVSPMLVLEVRQEIPGNISPVGFSVVIGRSEAALVTESTVTQSEAAPPAVEAVGVSMLSAVPASAVLAVADYRPVYRSIVLVSGLAGMALVLVRIRARRRPR